MPTNPAEALKAWSQVIDHLEEQRKISLRGYFEFARVLKWTPTELDLGFADRRHSRWAGENAAEKQNMTSSGDPRDARPQGQADGALLDAAEPRRCRRARSSSRRARSRTAERNKREAEAREHPITKHVLQTFGAQIKEIKTDV